MRRSRSKNLITFYTIEGEDVVYRLDQVKDMLDRVRVLLVEVGDETIVIDTMLMTQAEYDTLPETQEAETDYLQ